PTRCRMEKRFAADLSMVRIHIGAAAARSAAELGAHAWTLGRHISFADGNWAPETDRGNRLLTHELVHVLQQGAAAPATSPPIAVDAPDSVAEREAHDLAGHGTLARAPTASPVQIAGFWITTEPAGG